MSPTGSIVMLIGHVLTILCCGRGLARADPLSTITRNQSSPEQVYREATCKIRKLTEDDLEEMRHCESVSLSIRADWELRRREMVLNGRISRTIAARFSGFLSGRTGITVPKWWEEVIASGAFTSDDPQFYLSFYNETTRSAAVSCNNKCAESAIERHAHKVSASTQTSDERPESVLPTHCCCALSESTKDMFVAKYHSVVTRFQVMSFASDGALRWTQTVWASGLSSFSGGGHIHGIEFADNARVVAVFGLSGDCVYMEVFRKSDGIPICRFATCY